MGDAADSLIPRRPCLVVDPVVVRGVVGTDVGALGQVGNVRLWADLRKIYTLWSNMLDYT